MARTVDPLVADLLAAREDAGLTKLALCRRLGITLRTLRRWETGEDDPNLTSLRALADAVGRKLAALPPGAVTATITADNDLIDWLAVDLACRGERVTLTMLERAAAVDRLDQVGYTSRQISDRLSLTRRTVLRYKARLRAQRRPEAAA